MNAIFTKALLVMKAKSPTIMVVGGLLGIGAGVVTACRATLRYEEVKNEAKEKFVGINKAWEAVNAEEMDDYTKEDYVKDLTTATIQTGWDFLKLYGPSILLIGGSAALILKGHSVLNTRNAALASAYKLLDTGFKAYRKRVIRDVGEDQDYAWKHGLKYEKVTQTETDENGKKVKTKKVQFSKETDDPNGISPYAKFFDESCSEWTKQPEYNFILLQSQQNYWNKMLRLRGHVFLNEVYDSLGIPRTAAGAVVGWAITKDGDNYIDFGIFNGESERARAFVNGHERSILLDFNVDGVIYDLL